MRLDWRVHTPQLLKDLSTQPGMEIMQIPLGTFGVLLAQVAQRARELNDPVLTSLMCRLTLYTIADPNSADYDEKRLGDILAKAEALKKETHANPS